MPRKNANPAKRIYEKKRKKKLLEAQKKPQQRLAMTPGRATHTEMMGLAQILFGGRDR